MMYLEEIPAIERREAFPAALSAGALMAQKANSYGGKRPPKDTGGDKDPPLEPHEMFTALEMAQAYLPAFIPQELLQTDEQAYIGSFKACQWLTPAQAEDVCLAYEDQVFEINENTVFDKDAFSLHRFFAETFAREWESIAKRAQEYIPPN